MGSSNGTRVNGRRVRSVLLNPGDVVMIGKTRLILVLPSTPAGTGAPQTQATLPAPPQLAAAGPSHRGHAHAISTGFLGAADDVASLAPDGGNHDDDGPIELMDLEALARPAAKAPAPMAPRS